MSKPPVILISTLLGLMCFVHGGSITTHAQSPPASAITLTAEDYLARGRMDSSDETIADLTKAIQLNPSYAEAYFERAETRFRWAKEYHTLSEDMKANRAILEAPLADYIRAIQLNPQYAIAYYQRGNIYAHIGDRQAALVDYSKAIQLNPQYADAYYQRGNVYAQVSDRQTALADYNKAIQLVSDDPEFYCARGLLRDQLGDRRGATTDYLQVVRFAPPKAVEQADNQRAITQFIRLIDEFPNLAHVYYRGIAYFYVPNVHTGIYRKIGNHGKKDLDQAIQINPKFADAYYYRGLSSSSSESIQDFTKAIELDPPFSAAYFERGLAQIREISYTDEIDVHARQNAIRDFSQAIELAPNYARAYYYRGRLHSLGQDDSKAVKDYAQALRLDALVHYYDPDVFKDYLQILKTPPRNSVDYYKRGTLRRYLGDESGAISDLNQAIRLDPNLANAYYYRGLASFDDKKRNDFTQALQLNPNFAAAHLVYLERGLTYSTGRSLEGGYDDFSAAIRLNPNFAQAFYARSGSYKYEQLESEQEKVQQKRLEDVTQAIRLDPDFAQTFCSARTLGDGGWQCDSMDEVPERYTQIIWLNPKPTGYSVYSVSDLVRNAQEQTQRVVKRSTQMIQNEGQSAEAYYKRGIAYLKLEQFILAIDDFTEAIKSNAKDAEPYSHRGFGYYRLKRYREAILDYTQAIQLNPDFAKAYFLRGLVHYDMGNHQQAISDTTQAIRLDWTLSTAYVIRGRSRFALGDRQNAQADLKIGLESLPSFRQAAGGAAISGGGSPSVYYTRGVSLARRGDKQAAISTLQRAANLYRSQGNMPRYQATLAAIQRLR
jgi:tetratricopeptide (TPR) repeat protein